MLGWWRLQRKASNQLIVSPENEVVRRLRGLGHRREPGFALLEGPRVVAEAAAAGVELEVLAVREGDDFDAVESRRITLSRTLFRSISQTVTPQGVLAIARVRETATSEAIAAARRRAGRSSCSTACKTRATSARSVAPRQPRRAAPLAVLRGLCRPFRREVGARLGGKRLPAEGGAGALG